MNLSSSGVISGTPTTSGAYTFTVHLVDSSPTPKAVTSGSLTLTVLPKPPTNLIASPQGPGIVTLTWTPSTSGDIESYNIHQGTSSAVYTTVISAGNVNQYVEFGLTSGQQMYFVVAAVSASGVESVVSNEVTTIVP